MDVSQTLFEFSNRQAPPILTSQVVHRVRAGENCPQTGYYITPARIDARRKFQEGQTMPSVADNYGEVIWQWDVNQYD